MARSKTSGVFTDADGNKIINKRFRGQRIYHRLGPVSQREAEEWLAHKLDELRQAFDYGARARRTFREAAIHYLANTKKASLDDDAMHIRALTPFIGDLELRQIHDGTLGRFIAHRQKRGVSQTTIKRALEVVRRILNLAARKWRDENGNTWLAQAPLLTMPVDEDVREPYPLSWNEQKLLLSELPPHLEGMALFKVNTGTREQEVCKLRWDWEVQVPELNTSVFVIPARFGGRKPTSGVKNRKDRLVVLNDVAKGVIESCRSVHPVFVFTWKKGPKGEPRPTAGMNNNAWWKAVDRAAARYEKELLEPCPDGFARLRVHDLRHNSESRIIPSTHFIRLEFEGNPEVKDACDSA